MNCILFVAVVILNKINNVHCYLSSEEYYDSDYSYETSEYYDTSEYESYETDYSYEDYTSGSYERSQLKLRENNNGMVDNEIIQRFISEMKAGSPTDLFGTNQHYSQPKVYKDLSRRFVLQYPYTEVKLKTKRNEYDRLTPKLASPELVLAVAKKSAVLEASKALKPSDANMEKEILRTGEYWNDVWREDANPENLLRTQKEKKNLEIMDVKIMPDSSLYDVVSKLKERSPRLLYIINNQHKEK